MLLERMVFNPRRLLWLGSLVGSIGFTGGSRATKPLGAISGAKRMTSQAQRQKKNEKVFTQRGAQNNNRAYGHGPLCTAN